MKNNIIVILLALMLMPSFAYANAVFLSLGGESIINIVDLPDDERFETAEGKPMDIGYIYKSISLLFIPLWNYDGRLVSMNSDVSSYIDLQPDQVIELLQIANMTLPEPPYLDAWHTTGGKILFFVLVAAITINMRRKTLKKDGYLSILPNAHDRLIDIIINGQRFAEVEQKIIDQDARLANGGLNFMAVTNYVASFITISIIDMSKITAKEYELINNDFFERLLTLKKLIGSKASSTIHYIYFVYESSPNAEEIRFLKGLKKRRFKKSTAMIPVIIDLDSHEIYARPGMYPSKKILLKCFVQAGNFNDAIRGEIVMEEDESKTDN